VSQLFHWYKVCGDGTADRFEDTAEIRAIIDNRPGYEMWTMSPEGAIKHGGVIATAFIRKTEITYDAERWIRNREMVPTGEITTTKITQEPTKRLT
jgi:hypothetical protein